MSAGYLYSVNSATQAVGLNGTINMGSSVRRYGCVGHTKTPYATTSGTTTTLSTCGCDDIYFDVAANFVVTPTAAGTVTITAFQDGVAIPGAVGTATVAAAATTVTIPLVFGVKVPECSTSSNITYVLTGAASSVTNAAQTVSKVSC